MAGSMNEIRDLLIGVDFGRKTTQLCYYDRRAEEPRSISMLAGQNQYQAPTLLGLKTTGGEFLTGLEAEYYAKEKGGDLIEDIYDISGQAEPISLEGGEKEPWELTAAFLKGMLRYLGVINVSKNTKCLAITCETLTANRVNNLKKAAESLGYPEDKCLLLDYEEAFYYHAMTQQKEPLRRTVGWFDFDGDKVQFRQMTIRAQSRPMIVRMEQGPSETLPQEALSRDEAFCKMIQKALGKELFASIQLTGEGFDQEWAKQSVKMLCFQKRKVYVGDNLYARGACAAARERAETHELKDCRFLSASLVTCDVGMELRVMGSNAYYPLITSGKNWYDCSASCEILLDGKEDLVFTVSVLGDPERKKVSMTLPGLPKRPDKTTRLRVSLRYISPDDCEVRAEDLGFGELFPSSGKAWRETVRWQEAAKEKS